MLIAFTCARLILEFLADAIEKLIEARIVGVGRTRTQTAVWVVHGHRVWEGFVKIEASSSVAGGDHDHQSLQPARHLSRTRRHCSRRVNVMRSMDEAMEVDG